MLYRVRYLMLADQSVGETALEASDAEAAATAVNADGVAVLSVEQARRWPLRGPAGGGVSIPLFCEELRSLLQAGLALPEALDTLHVASEQAAAKRFAGNLLDIVRQGRRFSDALDDQPEVPKVLVGVVRGSEFTSGVATALGRYLEHHERLDELKNKAISASIYPAIVLGLGIVIVFFLLGYVVPKFSAIYLQHLSGVSFGSRFILRIGTFVAGYWPALVLLAVVAAAFAARWLSRLRQGGVDLDRVARMPFVGHAVQDFEAARVFETLAMLVSGGFTVPTSLRIAMDVAITSRMRTALQASRTDVERGLSLSSSIRRNGVGDEVAARLLNAGELAGDLGRSLEHAALQFSRRFSRRVERATKIVEPALLIVVGATIGVIVLLMYMPIFDLAGGIR